MKKHLLKFIRPLLLCCGILGTDTGAAETDVSLQQEFAAPPSEFRLVPIRHGRHAPDQKCLDWLAERHAGGAVLNVREHVVPGLEMCIGPKYLDDPIEFERLRNTMTRLKANGLKVWLYDELGYPSGNAGGRVLDGHPEYQAQGMRCRILETSGHSLDIKPEGQQIVSCRAFPYDGENLDLSGTVDLSADAQGGEFHWKPPKSGRWKVLVFERFIPDTWKRHSVTRRNINIMDRKAVARFIELTHERYSKELGPQLDDVVLFFTDEPQLSAVEPWMDNALSETIPAVQWTDELPIAFERKNGYPLADALPALFHNIGPSTARYRYDFYDVYSDLIADNYYGQIQDWCHKHNQISSGHMLLEESLLFFPMFTGSMTKNWARQDMPGVDQLFVSRYKTMGLWNQNCGIEVKEDFSIKMAASICTLTDKRGVFSESYGLSEGATNLARKAKGMAAWQYACGVTHMASYTIQDEISSEEYAGLSDFVGRLAVLCRRGQPVCDVAVLVPEASVWAFYNPPSGGTFKRYIECNPEVMQIDEAFRETCHQLLSHQRDFEVFTEELLGKAKVNKGRLELADQRFAFLVLPEARMLSEASMQKVEAFAASGGCVIFIGSLPSMSPAKGKDPAMHKRAKGLIRLLGNHARCVEEKSRFGETVDWMAKQVMSEIRWHGPRAVRLAHQREPGREIILIANPSAADAEGKLACRFAGNASIWNPETGERQEVGMKASGEAISIVVPADSARFVVFEKSESGESQ